MPPKESLYPARWLMIAEKDLKRAEHLLSVHDPEGAGFNLQQAVEKFLKAFLLSKGWRLARIHNLDTLLNDTITFDISLESYRSACQKITGFYFVERYPLNLDEGMTEKDVSDALEEVKGLIAVLREGISKQ